MVYYRAMSYRDEWPDFKSLPDLNYNTWGYKLLLTIIIIFAPLAAIAPIVAMFYYGESAAVAFWAVPILVVILIVAYLHIAKLRLQQMQQIKSYVAERGMAYERQLAVKSFRNEGAIFGLGIHQTIQHYFATTVAGLFIEFFVYSYSVNRDDATPLGFQVARIKLPKKLPHILLDSKHNDTNILGYQKSSINHLDKQYRISLEGDFDQHYQLYSAFPHPQDTLTILTPDVMQELIRLDDKADIEIVGDRLMVFTPISASGAHQTERISRLLREVTKALLPNIEKYQLDSATQSLIMRKYG